MPRLLCCALLLALAAPLALAQEAAGRKFVKVPGGITGLPFSDAVLVGDTLYVAGRIGIDPKTRKVPEKLEDEIRLMMDAIKTAVEAGGLTMDDVVSVQVFCPDLSLYDRFNAVYKTYFREGRYPARAFIGSGPLLFGGHFEVNAIAVRSKPAPEKPEKE